MTAALSVPAPSPPCVLHSVVQSCPTLRPCGLQPTRLLCPWGFSRQEYWSGLPCPPPGDLPNLGIEPRSPALQADSLLSEPPGQAVPSFSPSKSAKSKVGALQRRPDQKFPHIRSCTHADPKLGIMDLGV